MKTTITFIENKLNRICKKKKNRRMRIFEHRISLLAGKFATTEQMLLTE